MQHLLNLSALKRVMDDPPKAQRLDRIFNYGEFDLCTQDQIENIIEILESHHIDIIKFLKDNLKPNEDSKS